MTGAESGPSRARRRAPRRPREQHAEAKPAKPWFVYLIECRDLSIYTGIAVDVAARYAAHASGRGARYTRSHPPLRLLAAFAYASRSAALRAEYRIRRLPARAKRELCSAAVAPV